MIFGGDWRLGFGAIIVASSVAVCTDHAAGVAPLEVEAEARAAFDRALARYPEPIQVHLARVELVRERSYGVPEQFPLMTRLMGDAAYAYYSMNDEAVTLLDAGFAERARWTGGDAREDEVAGLMGDLGLVEEGGDVGAAWTRFVETVQGWPGDEPIAGTIRFGDARVLDRFVRLGVGRALARDWETLGGLTLEQQMVHELAHALQLGKPLMMATARMEAWGTLSGWVRADRNEPFDGFHGGVVMMEDPAVLGRLLVSNTRGDGLYAHAPGARFVNRYARYDAREDYAESVRLFMEDPERLIQIDPVKFMFINAIGYNAALSLDEPGPLWISAETVERRGWRELVQLGAQELLAGREGIKADPRTIAGLLRAHASLLRAEGLPECDVFDRAPTDAPDSIAKGLRPEDFSAQIGGERFGPDAAEVERLHCAAIVEWHQDDVFWRSMNELMEPDAEGIEDEFSDLAAEEDPQKRAMAAARLLAHARQAVGEKRLVEMMAREVRAMRAADEHLLAETLKLRFGIAWDGSVSADLVDLWQRSAADAGDVYSAVELQRGLVDLLLLWEDEDRATKVANSIGGESWGLLRKVEALCAIARHSRDASTLDAASDTLAGRPATELTTYLEHMISETREEIASVEEDEE